VLVETGDLVGAAQLIAELEPTDYQLRVQEAEAALLQAEAQARNADASYARVRGLYENRNASRQDLDAARAQAESAQAQIDAARQRLEQARAQLSYTRLRAPVDGSIASVLIETSENVTAGQRIAMLTAGTRPQVEVAVPESLIADVERGERVQVTFDALPGQDFEGSVTEVGVAATGLATTFPVTVALIEEAEAVRSGMAANVSFTFGAPDASERFLLPPHSVLEDRQGRFVFVAVPTDTDAGLATVERRGVRVGDLTGDGLEVLSGIVDEDLVITAGVSQVQEGLIVRIDSASRETS
jgi:RND family efflux transporter MFP subunit